MESTLKENDDGVKQNEDGLKHGQFKTTIKISDNDVVEHVVNPPSQEELADDWHLVIPQRRKNSTVHHLSIYLSQLPPYLWKSLHTSHTDNTEHYIPIDDGIYQYSVKMSKYDDEIQQLYKLVMEQYVDKNKMVQLYNHLEKQRVKGWLMIRAKNILSA